MMIAVISEVFSADGRKAIIGTPQATVLD